MGSMEKFTERSGVTLKMYPQKPKWNFPQTIKGSISFVRHVWLELLIRLHLQILNPHLPSPGFYPTNSLLLILPQTHV